MYTLSIDKSRISRLQDTILERYRRYGPIYRETTAGETIVHLLRPDYIQTVYQNEGKIPYLVPLMETTQMYRRLRQLSPGLGNTYVIAYTKPHSHRMRCHAPPRVAATCRSTLQYAAICTNIVYINIPHDRKASGMWPNLRMM